MQALQLCDIHIQEEKATLQTEVVNLADELYKFKVHNITINIIYYVLGYLT